MQELTENKASNHKVKYWITDSTQKLTFTNNKVSKTYRKVSKQKLRRQIKSDG